MPLEGRLLTRVGGLQRLASMDVEIVGPGPVGGGGERNRARAPRRAWADLSPLWFHLSHIDLPPFDKV